MVRRLERSGVLLPFEEERRVPLFHLFHLYIICQVTNCELMTPACACNDGTEGLSFEWGRAFHLCSIKVERWNNDGD